MSVETKGCWNFLNIYGLILVRIVFRDLMYGAGLSFSGDSDLGLDYAGMHNYEAN